MKSETSDGQTGRDKLLLMLHSAQREELGTNHVPASARSRIARELGTSVAEVDGIMSFYTIFSRSPRGRYVIRLCDSLSCRIRDSLDVYRCIRRRLDLKAGETTPDGRFSLEIVNCVGSCDTAPNAMINESLYTHLTPERMERLIDELSSEALP